MCHNVRRHFIAVSTTFQDCLPPNCLFSSGHVHPTGVLILGSCRSQSCTRLMALPTKNPIPTGDEVMAMVQVSGMR
ncbi:hypothetical protein EV424DRAFT_1404806, partial [Suillus variegatus]